MGGMADGAHCAEIALSSFLFRLTHDTSATASQTVRAAALTANAEVYRQYRERGGTTLAAIVVFPGSAAAVSVGDSRIYAAGPQRELRQISTDDTIAGELNNLKEYNASRSGLNSFAGQLAQFVGTGEGMEPRLYPITADLTYLLTSDGVHNINAETLKEIVSSGGTPHRIVSRLLQVSRWCGGSDNATAICVSPLHIDWSLPQTGSNSDWLEIWDAVGELEIPVQPLAELTASRGGIPKIDQSLETKTKRTRKRDPGARKKEPRSEKPSTRPVPAQGSLKIEIVDEKPPDAAASATERPSPTEEKSTSTGREDGKRE